MRTNFWTRTIAATLTLLALATVGGCKKKEVAPPPPPAVAAPVAPAAPVIPELPDVDLVAGDNIGGWLTLQSADKLFQAIDAIGAKVGSTPPGTRSKDLLTAELNQSLASGGVTGIEWLDWAAPMHIVFQDELPSDVTPAAGAPEHDTKDGIVVVLHTLDKAKTLAAFTQAKRGAEADGHELMLGLGFTSVYVDFVGDKTMVFTTDKTRFEKVKGFVGRLDKVKPPALLYLGLSAEDLLKTRKADLEELFAEFDKNAAVGDAEGKGDAGVTKTLQGYSKTLRGLVSDLRRFELLIDADVQTLRFEMRVTARDGSKLHKQLGSGKGRTPREIAKLLPANSYFAFASASDPMLGAETLDESLSTLKDALELDQPAYDALVADMKQVVKLQDGNTAMALYPDGKAAVGALAVSGATDGEAALKLTKRIVGTILTKLIENEMADAKQPSADMAAVKQAVSEMKLQAMVDKYGPMAAEKGVTITLNTSKDGDATCDTLDFKFDYAKMQTGSDTAVVKTVLGDTSALAVCTTKTKLSLGVGPSALENAKRAVQGKPAGLTDAPVFKAAVAKQPGASWQMYLNPGAALTAFANVAPGVPKISGDKAVVANCQNRKVSLGCELELPVDLLVEVKHAADGEPMPSTNPAMPGGALGAGDSACAMQCLATYSKCSQGCGQGDLNCASRCAADSAKCAQSCPQPAGQPAKAADHGPRNLACSTQCLTSLTKCSQGCRPDDLACASQCAADSVKCNEGCR